MNCSKPYAKKWIGQVMLLLTQSTLTMNPIYKKAAIVGIGQTDFSRNSGRTEWQLGLQAIQEALDDAGLEAADVDGLVRYSHDNVTPAMVVRALGMRDLRWYSDIPFGGTAQCGAIAQACAAIASGIARTVVIWRALNERSGVRYGRAERHIASQGEEVHAIGDTTPSGQFSGPYGLHVPGQCMAMWAARYAYEAGLDDGIFARALGTIATGQRAFANRNPNAMMRDHHLTMDDYLAGRMISEPLRLFDYCLESDGAVALVVTGADAARELRNDPVYVCAAQQSLYPHSEPITVYADDLMVQAGPGNIDKLYRDAGISPSDVDFIQAYDATSYMVLADLENYGFVRRGAAWRHVLDNGIGLDSGLPINTHGGHLSEAYVHGLNHIVEAVRQLRGTAASQVRDAEIGLLSCTGGASSAILAR